MVSIVIGEYRISDHARLEMERRGISDTEIAQVLRAPEQAQWVRDGRAVCQSRIAVGTSGRTYLLRVFIDMDRRPPQVVTAYRTSKIDKYWSSEP